MIILIKQLCLCVSLFYNLSPPKGLAQFCRIKVSKLSRNIWIFPKVCFQEYIDYLHFSTIHVKAAYTKFHINYTVQVLNFLWTIASNHICWYSSLEFYFNLTPVFGNTKFSFCNPTNLWRRIFVQRWLEIGFQLVCHPRRTFIGNYKLLLQRLWYKRYAVSSWKDRCTNRNISFFSFF